MVLTWLSAYVEKPDILLTLIPLLIFVLWLVSKDFRRREKHEEHRDFRRSMKIFLFITRGLIFTLLILALSSPYALYQNFIKGEPAVVFLVDNSSSYDLFQRSRGQYLYDQLKQQVDIELREFGDMQKTALGDELQQSFRRGKSVLVMSDGQVTSGSSLGDAVLRAQELNTTINVVKMEPVEEDYALVIDGPSKISSGVETEFTARVTGSPFKEHVVKITIDGTESFEKRFDEETSFTKKFDDGYHTIKAELYESDHFKENNIYYKSVKVIKEPFVTLMSFESSPLSSLLKGVYQVRQTSTLDTFQEDYAVIMNDIPFDAVEDDVQALQQFVSNGNGLVVVGGLSSFERGGYKESALESILPVVIAGAEKQEGGSSVVVLIDISQSFAINPYPGPQESRYTEGDIGVSKALAINILEGLRQEDYVGVIAFDTAAYVISDLDVLFKKDLNILEDKIASLQPAIAGQTLSSGGITEALDLLIKGPGGKNIILITDGQIQKRDEFLSAAEFAGNQGVTIYTIGVGEQTNEHVLQQVAEMTGGQYFAATQKNKLKLLFGAGEPGQADEGYAVVLKDRTHFITKDLTIGANIYGFNQAVPKASAQLLAMTHQGDPLLVSWRYGLGRVVTILTDDGKIFAGELLEKKNSKLLLRALSWAAGDPERKSTTFITIPDGRVGEKIEVLYRGDQPPQGTTTFTKIEENLYRGYLEAKTAGFHTFWQATYAVNEPAEYEHIGFNPELEQLARQTGGKVFTGDDLQDMTATLKGQSQDVVLEKWQYQQPFVLAALLIFLLEICIRRILYFRRR